MFQKAQATEWYAASGGSVGLPVCDLWGECVMRPSIEQIKKRFRVAVWPCDCVVVVTVLLLWLLWLLRGCCGCCVVVVVVVTVWLCDCVGVVVVVTVWLCDCVDVVVVHT